MKPNIEAKHSYRMRILGHEPIRDAWILDGIWQMPLASCADVAMAFGREITVAHDGFNRLVGQGLIDSRDLGHSERVQRRYWLSEKGFALHRRGAHWVHTLRGLRTLSERLASAEVFYKLVPEVVASLGEDVMRRFRWMDSDLGLMNAAVVCDHSWALLGWSGRWQTQRIVNEALLRLGKALYWLGSAEDMSASPGLYVVVTCDSYQRDVVWRVLRRYGLDEHSVVVPLDGGTLAGDFRSVRSEMFVAPIGRVRDDGVDGFGDWLDARGAVGAEGKLRQRVMGVIEEWPGVRRSYISDFMGEPSSGLLGSGLQNASSRSLAERVGDGYYLSRTGYGMASRRDNQSNGFAYGRHGRLSESATSRKRIEQHDWPLMRVMAKFSRGGCPVAAGWRGLDLLPGSRLAPDGMVYLRGPWGAGWHYVEYEQRALGPARIGEKLAPYRNRSRSNNWPLLVICRNARHEETFRECIDGLPVLTTHIKDVAEGGVLGAGGANWRNDWGDSVALSPASQ